ncbi:zinc fingers and homeoboxes protein 2-like [Megalops cyprinoides]|uniref:zinc fingers and homeoboxes protein 2-like n=1 Tax=Megalops cyprinoides TaxID=118141 RepID=UPI0018652797|nr:zinc fingers and homeoboxes protein 2-like [Megalops cyprinoides]XP_036411155.1 zinc fingers and homeoboxes protein 2-like [Megalops cyprinoides]
MASRRKSTIPCMIRINEVTDQDDLEDMEVSSDSKAEDGSAQTTSSEEWASGRETVERESREAGSRLQRKQQGGYECKYCPFSTQNLNDFKEHVDSNHPNVILNPLYLCAVCNFNTKKFDTLTEHNEKCHPGETNFKFKRIKLNNQTILEQTIEGVNSAVTHDTTIAQCGEGFATFPLSKPTTVKIGKPKMDNKQIFHKGEKLENHLDSFAPKDQITAVNVNGTVIIPEATIKEGLSHVMPLLQRPPNFNLVPKIAVPLNTTKYNPLLDSNMTLITSFNKFPYPTHAELSWLTAASKHPEEQIKVWFTTQRLKQGITWSPEEVEEARKKMFNGTIPPVHQTFTVLPAPLTEPAKVTQPLIQTVPCQLLGQSSLVLTTVANGSTVTCPPVSLSVSNQAQTFKRPLAAPSLTPEGKRPMAAPAVPPEVKRPMAAPAATPVVVPAGKRPIAAPMVAPEGKRGASAMVPMIAPEMKRPMAAPMVAPDIKRPLVAPVVAPEVKRPMAPPAAPVGALEMKRPMAAPVIVSEGRVPSVAPLAGPEQKQTIAAPVVPSEVKRPTIIKSIQPPLKAASPISSFPLDCKKTRDSITELQASYFKSQFPEDKEVHRLIEASGFSQGNIKNSFSDKHYRNHKGILHLGSTFLPKDTLKKSIPTQFPLLERVKGKTSEQLKILEESFQRSSFPTLGEIDCLVTETRLSKNEINSWFSERRALRDNLEQALLNSMGSKKAHVEERQRQGMLNGMRDLEAQSRRSPIPIVAPSAGPIPIDSKSLGQLKDVFAQTRWPSPEEYNHLELQTGLARTDIVRWFKDSRLALKSGTLEWMELFQKLSDKGQNGLGLPASSKHAPNVPKQRYQDGKMPEDVKRLSEGPTRGSQEINDWFSNKLGQNTSDAGKNGGQDGQARENHGSWVKMTAGVDGDLGEQELVSDSDNVAEDIPGRVTG